MSERLDTLISKMRNMFEVGDAICTYGSYEELAEVFADDRALFLRRYWFGDPVQTIARDLGLRENAASVRLGRLRTQLREFLMKEGYVDE